MAGKRRRLREAAATSEPAANEEAPEGKNLTNRFSQLFGGGSSGGNSGLSSFLAGGASSGSSASATPSRPAPAPIRPAAPMVASTPAVAQKRSSTTPGAEGGVGRGVPVSLEAPEEEKPQSKRRSEEELRERETRTLFIGNVPLDWEKSQLRKALRTAVGDKYTGQFRPIWFRAEPLEEKWQGNLRKVGSIKRDHATNAANAKNAYVVLDSPENVTTVRHLVHGHVADERHVLRADGVGAAAKLQSFDRKRSVFVGNLPASCSEADLRDVFAKVGQVDAVRVVRDRVAKACKGFAFVRFKDRTSVKAAMNLWGVELQGRPIRVMKVTQPEGGESDATRTPAGASSHPAAKRIDSAERRRTRSWQWDNGARKPRKSAIDRFKKEQKSLKKAKAVKKDRLRAKKANKQPKVRS